MESFKMDWKFFCIFGKHFQQIYLIPVAPSVHGINEFDPPYTNPKEPTYVTTLIAPYDQRYHP